jgi:hypothetical protein
MVLAALSAVMVNPASLFSVLFLSLSAASEPVPRYRWMVDREATTPDAFTSQSTTKMSAATFKIFFIFPVMGMYALMSQSPMRTMTRLINKESSDIIDLFPMHCLPLVAEMS